MKKLFLIISIVLTTSFTTSSFAQEMSLRGGVNVSSYSSKANVYIGALGEFKIMDKLAIETGININTLSGFYNMELYLGLPLGLKFYAETEKDVKPYISFGGFFGHRFYSSGGVSELGLAYGIGLEINSFLIGVNYDRAMRDITNNSKSGESNLRIYIGVKLGE